LTTEFDSIIRMSRINASHRAARVIAGRQNGDIAFAKSVSFHYHARDS